MLEILLLTIIVILIMLFFIKCIEIISTKKSFNEIKTEQKVILELVTLQTQLNPKTVMEKLDEELRKLNDM